MARHLNPRFSASSSMLGSVALAVIALTPGAAWATTVSVTGGAGLDQGALCVTGASCPGTPTYSLVGTDPVTGSFTYNSAAETVSFALTLTANASFGAETLLSGSTFSATGVPVIAGSLGGGAIEVVETGSANGLADVSFNPGLPLIQSTPLISGLSCTLGTGSDQCGVSFGPSGLEVGPATGTDYQGFVTFNTDVRPVPLPASAWLLLSGLGCCALGRRRPS